MPETYLPRIADSMPDFRCHVPSKVQETVKPTTRTTQTSPVSSSGFGAAVLLTRMRR